MLPTPHFEQSSDGMCLPACTRMVLAHWNHFVSESKLASLLGTKRYGTPISNITRLQRWNYTVTFGTLTQTALQNYIGQGCSVIVQVWAPMLTYWKTEGHGSHVVVVMGYDDQHIYLNDPATSQIGQPLVWDAFLVAWAEHDETAVIILP